MSAIAEAVERGKQAANQKSNYEPVGVRHNGRLVAEVVDRRSGEVDGNGIYEFRGQLLYVELGLSGDNVTVHRVRSRELKKIARAMICIDEFQDDLVNEACAVRRERVLATVEAPR